MMTALFAAFWLQLESASSAAVCVGTLALPTRGLAYEKALYRIAGTVVGVIASIVIAGLFSGVRDLFVLAISLWLAACVYVASLLEGNRSYGAVLTGFTVAIVAVANIDTPQEVWSAGVNRGAAIIVGVVSVMVFSDLFAAPNVFSSLLGRLEDTHRRVIAFAHNALRHQQAEPQVATDLLRTIVAFRAEISALPAESIAGSARASAARTVVAAMAREVTVSRAFASVLCELGEEARDLLSALSKLLDDPFGPEADALNQTIDFVLDSQDAASPLFVAASAAHILVEHDRKTLAALEDLRRGRASAPGSRLLLFRAPQAAFRNALRVFLVMLVGAVFFIATGWPATSYAMVQLGALVAISANAPSSRQFAIGGLIAMFLSFAFAGINNFLILDGVNAFPLLVIGMAPAIIGGGLLAASPNPKLAPIGTLVLVFTPTLMSIGNPQTYDPRTYLTDGFLANVSTIILFIVLATVLPTSDDQKRGWMLRSLRADFGRALQQSLPRHTPDEYAFRYADLVGQLGALPPAALDHRNGLRWAELTLAAWRVRAAIADPRLPQWADRDGRAALVAKDPAALRGAATRLLAARTDGSEIHSCRLAATAMAWMATLIECSPREVAELGPEPAR
jgi:uncharacterized membrane protein YccC